MALLTPQQNPTLSDTLLFTLTTVDDNGYQNTPYKVNSAIIYFLARDFVSANAYEMTAQISDTLTTETYFSNAQIIAQIGNDDYPAWLSTDINAAYMTNAGNGTFALEWTPTFCQSGDFIICFTWTPLPAGDTLSSYQSFYLAPAATTMASIPTHLTNPNKYTTLLNRYLPEYVTTTLSGNDLTADVLTRFNAALAQGFTYLENFANQSYDLLDANAIPEAFLLYLAGNFNLVLRSDDTTLWRRQIKNAVPLYKKKGTLGGLKEALAQAGITFVSFTPLWQVSSPYTYQDAFTATAGQTEFVLSQIPYVSGSGIQYLYYRPHGSPSYADVTSNGSTVTYDSVQMVGTLNWAGVTLNAGDIIRVIYKTTSTINTGIETHIRLLPLADSRDETTVTYPPKNWNVYVIEETDSMFNAICPTLNPYADPIVYGQIRTEFPYSENIYNMEEYNGSLRNSTNPCDLSKTFLDDCSCCRSSKFNLDIAIQSLSDRRIAEAKAIIAEYTPFHAVLHRLSYQSAVTEFLAPQQESIDMLIDMEIDDSMVVGNKDFYRTTFGSMGGANEVKRNALANIINTVNVPTGVTYANKAIVLYSPGVRFDEIRLNTTSNLLEILSGVNGPSGPTFGKFQVTNPQATCVDIAGGNNITFTTNSFPFRLSNLMFSGSVNSVKQGFVLSDTNIDFIALGVNQTWSLIIGGNPYLVDFCNQADLTNPGGTISSHGSGTSGLYTLQPSFGNITTATMNVTASGGGITNVTINSGGTGYPTNSTILLFVGGGSGGVISVTTNSLGKVITVNSIMAVGSGYSNSIIGASTTTAIISTTGVVTVVDRGFIDGDMYFATQNEITTGDYVYIGSDRYLITSVPTSNNQHGNYIYIDGWAGGNVGVTPNVSVYRRLLDNTVGYLDYRGLIVTTTTNYESVLGIQNGGSNYLPTWTATPVGSDPGDTSGLTENNTFKENFLVLIGGNYYTIADITTYNITLNGPQLFGGTTPITLSGGLEFLQFGNAEVGPSFSAGYAEIPPEPVIIQGHSFSIINRRTGDVFDYTVQTQPSMSMVGSILNRINFKQPLDYHVQNESISMEIEWRD